MADTNAQSEGTPGQAEQTTVQGGQAAGGADAPGAKPGEQTLEPRPRQRKEKLPGVVTRDDGEDLFPDLGFKSKTGKRVGRKEAEKELGLEIREEMGLEIPEAFKKPGEVEPEVKPDEKAPQKIKFNGKEYDSMAAIEQEHKSLQGMFKSFDARMKNAEAMAEKAAESARSWRQRAMELEGTAPQPQQTQPQGRPQPTDEQSAEQELTSVMQHIDGDRFEALAREHGLPIAGRYLAAQVLATVHDQMLPKLAESIMAQMQEQFAPYTQSVEFQQQTNEVGTLIDNVSQLRNPDGNLAFPELNDQNELMEVAELWSGMDSRAATPQSLIQAIALYRLYRGARGGQTSNQPAVNVTPPPTTVRRPESLPAGGPGATPATPRAGAGTEDSRFARALDEARLVDPVLGFARRRR